MLLSAVAASVVIYYVLRIARECLKPDRATGGTIRRAVVPDSSLNTHIVTQWTDVRLRLDFLLALIKKLEASLEQEVGTLRRLGHDDPQYEHEARQMVEPSLWLIVADIRRHVHRYSKELLREVHRHAVNVSSALITGGIVMSITLTFALFSILLLGTPGYAQNPCVDCLKAAQEQLTQCLGSAISQEDKKSCVERRQEKSKTCENSECVIERAKIPNKNDVLSQKK